MNVTVIRSYRGKFSKDSKKSFQNYSYLKADKGIEQYGIPVKQISPIVIPFYDTATPTITDYDIKYYNDFGNFPRIMILRVTSSDVEGDTDEYEEELSFVPIRYKFEGILRTLTWDLPEPMSGKIIIY